MRSCDKLQGILDSVLQSVDSSLGSPLCKLATQLDVRSQFIRVEEVPISLFTLFPPCLVSFLQYGTTVRIGELVRRYFAPHV